MGGNMKFNISLMEEENTSSCKDNLVLIAPVVAYIVIPLIYVLYTESVKVDGWLYITDEFIQINLILRYSSYVCEAIAIGLLSYVIMTKSLKLNILYLLVCMSGFSCFYRAYHYFYKTVFSAYFLGFMIAWGLILVVSKLIRKNIVKLLVLTAVAMFGCVFMPDVISGLSYSTDYFDIFLSAVLGMVVKLIISLCVGVIWIVFSQYYNIDPFGFDGTSDMQAVCKCPVCNKVFYEETNFCGECGAKVIRVSEGYQEDEKH